MASDRTLWGSTLGLNAIGWSWSAYLRAVKYRFPTSMDMCSWKSDGAQFSIVPFIAVRLNMSWISYIDATFSSNFGDESPVSITDCLMYCRRLSWLPNVSLHILEIVGHNLHFKWSLNWRQFLIAYYSLNTEDNFFRFYIFVFFSAQLPVWTYSNSHRPADALKTVSLFFFFGQLLNALCWC